MNDIDWDTVRDYAERGSRARDVLYLLIKAMTLTDGIVRLGVDAAELGFQSYDACQVALAGGGLESLANAVDRFQKMRVRARRVEEQIAELSITHDITPPQLGAPDIPRDPPPPR